MLTLAAKRKPRDYTLSVRRNPPMLNGTGRLEKVRIQGVYRTQRNSGHVSPAQWCSCVRAAVAHLCLHGSYLS